MLGRRHGDHTRGSLAVAVVTVFRVLSAPRPIHAAADALVKWTRSLSLREPVTPSGPGAIAVFLLGSQRARRCQIGPVLGHGDLAVSVVFWFSVYSG